MAAEQAMQGRRGRTCAGHWRRPLGEGAAGDAGEINAFP